MSIQLLITLLIMIESNGNDSAIGDNGLAVGCLQIHPCVIADVNRVYGAKYSLDDRLDRKKSIEICWLYLQYWATPERLGAEPKIKDYVRIWNGGPNGHKKDSTLPYWYKFTKSYREYNNHDK